MKDIESVVQDINSRLREKDSFSGVYKDEPIIKPASSMSNYTPPRISELAEMPKKREYALMPRAELFVTAGKMAADITDDYDKSVPFFCYYPTYRDMNRAQLRTYFTWRTAVRAGNTPQTSYSYAFVYIYELINLIGVSSAEEAFEKLRDFMLDYSVYEHGLIKYYNKWLIEFAVYYDLQGKRDEVYSPDNDIALDTLIHYAERSDEELFSAAAALSSYKLEASPFFAEHGEDCRRAVCRVYRAWADYYGSHRTKPLSEKLFGVSVKRPVSFFEDAVFFEDFDNVPHEDREYSLSPLYRFACRDGRWTAESYPAGIKKNSEIGAVLKETERILRRELGYNRQLRESLANKTVLGIIEKEISGLMAEKREQSRREIVINVSALEKIRQDADITRDRLITEAEREAPEDVCEAAADTADTRDEELLLDGNERELLALLLEGGDGKAFAREKGIMLSMLCESINEKLYDIIGDIVIEFDGDRPYIIEDYTDEVKELL